MSNLSVSDQSDPLSTTYTTNPGTPGNSSLNYYILKNKIFSQLHPGEGVA